MDKNSQKAEALYERYVEDVFQDAVRFFGFGKATDELVIATILNVQKSKKFRTIPDVNSEEMKRLVYDAFLRQCRKYIRKNGVPFDAAKYMGPPQDP